MRSWPAYVLVIATAATASAGEPVEEWTPPARDEPSYQLALSGRALAALMAPRTGWSAGLFASAAASADRNDGQLATLAVGGQLATGGLSDKCRYLRARGAVYAATDRDGRHHSADVTTTACLFRAVVFDRGAPGLTVEHHLAYAVQPSLSARRSLLRGEYTAHNWRIDGSAFEGRDSKLPYGSALFPFHVDVDRVGQGALTQTSYGFSLEGMRITPPEHIIFGAPANPDAVAHVPADELAVLGLFVRAAASGEEDLTVGGLDFGRVDGLRVGHGISMDFAFGLAVGAVGAPAAAPTPDPAMAPPPHSSDVFTPRGGVAAAQRRDAVSWRASYRRDLFPTVDGAFALEDRLDASVELHRGLPGVQVTGFAAHTELYRHDDQHGDWTAGASVARQWELGDHLSLLLSAEAARSYYATLDVGSATRPEPAARALAVVSGHLGTR
ncbi:MAG: hypothetical protein IPH80_02660 [Myxococcales bacterium]|nr:hypothetical protein [Myxococcales bacterium]